MVRQVLELRGGRLTESFEWDGPEPAEDDEAMSEDPPPSPPVQEQPPLPPQRQSAASRMAALRARIAAKAARKV